MNENERDDFLDSLQNQWNAFNARISAFGFFIGGFESTHAGLKSDVGEDWQILGFYDFQNYDDFYRCTAILDDPQFLSLRNYCDIRMLFGEKKSSFSNTITELF
jgi:hypothetical protein